MANTPAAPAASRTSRASASSRVNAFSTSTGRPARMASGRGRGARSGSGHVDRLHRRVGHERLGSSREPWARRERRRRRSARASSRDPTATTSLRVCSRTAAANCAAIPPGPRMPQRSGGAELGSSTVTAPGPAAACRWSAALQVLVCPAHLGHRVGLAHLRPQLAPHGPREQVASGSSIMSRRPRQCISQKPTTARLFRISRPVRRCSAPGWRSRRPRSGRRAPAPRRRLETRPPDISNTTSTCSPPLASRMAAVRSSAAGSTAASAPSSSVLPASPRCSRWRSPGPPRRASPAAAPGCPRRRPRTPPPRSPRRRAGRGRYRCHAVRPWIRSASAAPSSRPSGTGNGLVGAGHGVLRVAARAQEGNHPPPVRSGARHLTAEHERKSRTREVGVLALVNVGEVDAGARTRRSAARRRPATGWARPPREAPPGRRTRRSERAHARAAYVGRARQPPRRPRRRPARRDGGWRRSGR